MQSNMFISFHFQMEYQKFNMNEFIGIFEILFEVFILRKKRTSSNLHQF